MIDDLSGQDDPKQVAEARELFEEACDALGAQAVANLLEDAMADHEAYILSLEPGAPGRPLTPPATWSRWQSGEWDNPEKCAQVVLAEQWTAQGKPLNSLFWTAVNSEARRITRFLENPRATHNVFGDALRKLFGTDK